MPLTTVQIETKLKDALDKGIILRAEGRHSEALLYMQSIESFFGGHSSFQRKFYNGLGITLDLHREFSRAADAYMRALGIPAESEEEEEERVVIEGNIAESLVRAGRPAEAHGFLDHAERFFRAKQDDVWLGDRLETRARAYLAEGKYREALDAAKEAFDLHWSAFLANTVNSESLGQTIRTLAICFEAYRSLKG